jgi:hypothetical protein
LQAKKVKKLKNYLVLNDKRTKKTQLKLAKPHLSLTYEQCQAANLIQTTLIIQFLFFGLFLVVFSVIFEK